MSGIPEYTNFYRCGRCDREWEDEGRAGEKAYCIGCGHYCFPLRTEKASLFRNHYQCWACNFKWTDEWTAICDDRCPECDARDCTPVRSVPLNAPARRQSREPSV